MTDPNAPHDATGPTVNVGGGVHTHDIKVDARGADGAGAIGIATQHATIGGAESVQAVSLADAGTVLPADGSGAAAIDVRTQGASTTAPAPKATTTAAAGGIAPPTVQRVAALGSGERARDVVLTVVPRLQPPSSSLFKLHAEPGALFLVETDPRFTQYRSFIGSDYFVQQLQLDPERQLKRYGDGFYEQSLVNDQVLALTGRRYLTGYGNTEDEFKSLMDAGVAFAKQYQLTPGVALTAEQMAQLTTDIVWLTAQSVTLADGSSQKVLVPQVYIRRAREQDLSVSGALMAGSDVLIKSSGDLSNSGSIQGDRVALAAGNDIVNRGQVRGADVLASAGRDLLNLGGSIQGVGAASQVTLLAGRDVVLQTTTQTSSNSQGSRTSVDRIAMVQGGDVRIDAGRDVIASGAQVNASVDLIATAGRDLVATAVEGKYELHVATGGNLQARNGYINEGSTTNQVTTFNAGRDVALVAQGNVSAKGTDIQAGGDVLVKGVNVEIAAAKDKSLVDVQTVTRKEYVRTAKVDESLVGGNVKGGGNVTVVATGTFDPTVGPDGKPLPPTAAIGGNITLSGVQVSADKGQVSLVANDKITVQAVTTEHQTTNESYSKSKTLVGGSTTTTAMDNKLTQVNGSAISGNTVLVQAGDKLAKTGDIVIKGSTIVADGAVQITAGRDLTVTTAEQVTSTNNLLDKSKSGLFASGASLTLGKQQQSQSGAGTSKEQVGSQIGSLTGSVDLQAGNQYTHTGSQIIVPQGDVNITAPKVRIDAATNIGQGTQDQHTKQSGLSLGVSSTAVNAAQTVAQMASSASKTNDPRMQALAAANAALTFKDAASAIGKDGASAGASISLSIGSSRSDSSSVQSSTTAVGSKIAAGGNVNVQAIGAGKDSNLDVIGSEIGAGGTTKLKADGKVNLEASTSTSEQHSTNSSSSGSIGIAYNFGGDKTGWSLNASASKGQGKADGTDVTTTNTRVSGDKVVIESGGDTNLKGAVVQGKQVTANVGGNLNIESVQDTSKYDAKQTSAGVGVSICVPPFCAGSSSVSVNASRAKVAGDYQSVTEQSGIKAGDGGFQVDVKGNTDLKGGVITSTLAAVDNKANSLTTATLTTSDIQNKDNYKASGVSVSVSLGTDSHDKRGNPTKDQKGGATTTPGIGHESGSQSSTTRSGISAGAITITDDAAQKSLTGQDAATTLAAINTNVSTDKDSSGSLKKAWDGQKLMTSVQAQMQITSSALPKLANEFGSYADKQANELRKAGNEAEAKKWDEGGAYRVAGHAAIGALAGGASGAVGAGAAAASAPTLNDLQSSLQGKLIGAGMSDTAAKEIGQLMTGSIAAGIGAATGGSAGAITGLNADANNRQLHWQNYLNDKADCAKNPKGSGCSTIEKMAGVKSQVVDFLATPVANVAVNTDANGNVVSYTILDKATNQPRLIMEPLEFQAFRGSLPGYQALMMTVTTQYSMDLASAGLYASVGNTAKTNESLLAAVTSPDYGRDVALATFGLVVGQVAAVKPAPLTSAEVGVRALPTAADATANSPYSSKGTQYGSVTYTDASGNPIPTGSAATKVGTLGADSKVGAPIDPKSVGSIPEILLPDPPVGNGPRSANVPGIGLDGYAPPPPTTPNAAGTMRAGQPSTIPEHLINEGGLTQGKNVYGTHDMEAFDHSLALNGGREIARTPIPGVDGIYEVSYQLPGKLPATKTVFDPKIYPAADMEPMAMSAAQSAINLANSSGTTGIFIVNVGGLQWRVIVKPGAGGVPNVPTAYPIGGAPWP